MNELIVKRHPKSPVSESYRALRTNILFSNVDKDTKTFMVTSATPGEGKSTTLTNTALTLAGAGHKTIILDCDFRKPRVHKIFEISNKSGITEMLLSEKTHHDFIHKKVVPNLDVMTAGNVPSNPSEILNSKAMKAFIETVKDEYDYVFIDAPPVLPVTDAVILSTYIDRVILVCAAGGVTFDMAKHAKDALERVGGQILGVVLNKISVKENSQYYYYYYGEKKDQK